MNWARHKCHWHYVGGQIEFLALASRQCCNPIVGDSLKAQLPQERRDPLLLPLLGPVSIDLELRHETQVLVRRERVNGDIDLRHKARNLRHCLAVDWQAIQEKLATDSASIAFRYACHERRFPCPTRAENRHQLTRFEMSADLSNPSRALNRMQKQ